jgi:glutathione S-transferase
MPQATLTISSKNYSSWSLRGWLLCRMAGLTFEESAVDLDDPESRQELLLLSPSVRVPRLSHDGVEVWDTLAIAEYLHEIAPEAGLLPKDRVARAHCRAVSGEIHSGFYNLRSALPMNLKARHKAFKVFSGARPDIERIREIWTECLSAYGGPWLFGAPSMADAMFAPVCTRVPHLRGRARPGAHAVLRDGVRLAAVAGMDRGRAGRAGRDRRARGGVLSYRDGGP